MKKSGVAFLGLLSIFGSVQTAFAKVAPVTEPDAISYISERDSSFGLKTLTFDSQTNLEWLDLNLTQGLSYTQVVSQLSTTFNGYRIATYDELNTFVLDSAVYKGLGNYLAPTSPPKLATALANLSILWSTNQDLYTTVLRVNEPGFDFGATFNQSSSAGNHNTIDIHVDRTNGSLTGSMALGAQNDSFFTARFGVALVRTAPAITSPVPEPTSVSLLIAGLGILGLQYRRKHQ